MDLTVTQVGTFTATGGTILIPLRGGVDWFRVYNYTQSNFASGAGTGTNGVQYYWQVGMNANDGFAWINNAGATAILQTTAAALAVGGFTFVDSSIQNPGPALAYTAGTNATPPVITVASTANLSTGQIVRITTSATAFNASGFDYTIEVLSGTTFSLRNMISPGAAFGAGTYRVILFPSLFYPRNRVISNITQAVNAVVQTTVDSGFQVGDQVRLNIPAAFGNYANLDSSSSNGFISYTVVAVTPATAGNPATFTINANTTGFGAFAWPAVASVPFTPAQVEPIGFYTDATIVTNPAFPITNPNLLLDATVNNGFIGMQLAGGAQSPGGNLNDVIFWSGGSTFSPNTILPLNPATL